MLNLFKNHLYIQISPELLKVRNPRTGNEFAQVPELAITQAPNEKILEIGASARSALSGLQGKVVNPFAHPRSLVSDFTVAQELLKLAVKRVNQLRFFTRSPQVVMHPLGNPLGGFTQIELRALRELANGVGAASVVLWTGRTLTDQEIVNDLIPRDGQINE